MPQCIVVPVRFLLCVKHIMFLLPSAIFGFEHIISIFAACVCNLYVTVLIVYEMVHCACELSGRTPVDHLTFGEFCILVTGLRRHYARKFVSLSFFFLWHLNCFPGIFMLSHSPPVLWATGGIILFTCLSVCMRFGRCILWLVYHRLLVCAYFISLLLRQKYLSLQSVLVFWG